MTVYAQGTFDLFHVGHLTLLKRCYKLAGDDGDVWVALLSDEAIVSYKGKLPVIPYTDRKKLLEACMYVSNVLKCEIVDTKQQIERLEPDYVVLGSDWVTKDIYTQYGMFKDELDKYLIYFPYTEGVSSTQIKEKIKHE